MIIPASRIAALSSGEFVGLVADNPDEKIKLKMFNAEIINDAEKLTTEISAFQDIPVVKKVNKAEVLDNYYQVKFDIKQLVEKEVNRLKEEKENNIM